MKSNPLGTKTATVALAALLSGCSSTGTSRVFSVLGPIMGSAGVVLWTSNEKPDTDKDADKSVESFWEIGPVYRHSLVNEVRDVPLAIRNIPIHPDDWGVPGPIADDEVTVGPRLGMFVNYGQKLTLLKDSLFLRAGVEMELSGMLDIDKPSRNYTNAVGTSERGYGAALTYYSIYTKAGPDWNSFLIPKVFVGLETKLSDSLTFGAGYKLWREDLVAETGYDRHDNLERRDGFGLVDMTIGSIVGSLKYNYSGDRYLFLEFGTQDILDKQYHNLGREADIDFADNSFTVSVGGHLTF